jgi:hypothetical protein
MPSRSVRAVVLLAGVALAAAACGSQSASPPVTTGATSPPVTTGPTSPPVTTGPTIPPVTTGPTMPPGTCARNARQAPPGPLTLGSRDSGTTFCLRVGQQVVVYLNGSAAHKWAPIHADSGALRPAGNGHLTLPLWVTGAAYTAVRPGTVHLTSARPVCTGRPARCDALIEFQVTLVIGDTAG